MNMIIAKQIDIHLAYAQLWATAAGNGYAEMRDICDGNHVQLTPEQKRKECMDTAFRHMHSAQELMEQCYK